MLLLRASGLRGIRFAETHNPFLQRDAYRKQDRVTPGYPASTWKPLWYANRAPVLNTVLFSVSALVRLVTDRDLLHSCREDVIHVFSNKLSSFRPGVSDINRKGPVWVHVFFVITQHSHT